ncbi:AAA family ATPase [Nostoc sphaeroides CHAB 2801]|uniref:AAA family ATPase n=1 Tax=Nostoc sphaeroides TaxID=446679 RepID=UPI001E4505BD|nr:AAA family ATPase [Nostoc sphaeroides]MCC5631966.1 AAA family ATPase [Nostoc sphaeroides CHAB 2801]
MLFFGEAKPTAIAALSGSINRISEAMMIQTLPTFAATGSFPFQLTQQQQKALDAMWTFIQPTMMTALFLLVGYAGTGKSTIVFQLIKVLVAAGKRVVLTAPTN